MMDQALPARVKRVLAAEWNVEAAGIPDDASLNGYEHWDSLGHISIMLALAAEFNFELDPENVQALTSLPAIFDHVALQAGSLTQGSI